MERESVTLGGSSRSTVDRAAMARESASGSRGAVPLRARIGRPSTLQAVGVPERRRPEPHPLDRDRGWRAAFGTARRHRPWGRSRAGGGDRAWDGPRTSGTSRFPLLDHATRSEPVPGPHRGAGFGHAGIRGESETGFVGIGGRDDPAAPVDHVQGEPVAGPLPEGCEIHLEGIPSGTLVRCDQARERLLHAIVIETVGDAEIVVDLPVIRGQRRPGMAPIPCFERGQPVSGIETGIPGEDRDRDDRDGNDQHREAKEERYTAGRGFDTGSPFRLTARVDR